MNDLQDFIPPPARAKAYMFATADDADIELGSNGMASVLGCAEYVSRIRFALETAPTGADFKVQLLLKDATTGATDSTIGTFTLTAAAFYSGELTFTATLIPRNKKLAATVSQIGSTLPGTGLTILVD